MEEEANEFAAEFLIPTEAVQGQLQTTNLKTYATHKLFWKVSMAALIRIKTHWRHKTDSQQRYGAK